MGRTENCCVKFYHLNPRLPILQPDTGNVLVICLMRNQKGTGWGVIHFTSFTELTLLYFHRRIRGKYF